MDFEQCQDNLDALIDREKLNVANRNEATTRLQLVDELIFGCLGWDKRDCVCEESHDGQFADYTLGKPYKYSIWEAKRVGIGFTLPIGLTSGILRLSTILGSGGGDVDAAIRQVLDYCQRRSVGAAVVCNGRQIVAFLANRQDNVPPLEGKALVFTSLEEMRLKFHLAWDNLSLPGAEARRLQKTLQSETVQPPPDKLSLRISGYPVFKNRNPFQNNLKMLAELFIEDLANIPANEEEFLRSCYSSNGALSQYALIGRHVLQSRYSMEQQRELKIDTLHSVADQKNALATEFSADLLAKGLRRRPIVLLGEVGVGKTIFLRHLLKVDAKEALTRAAVFYIDFLKGPALVSDIRSYILRRCKEILYQDLRIDIMSDNFVRGVYHFELERFEKSVYGAIRESDPPLYKQKEIEFLESKLEDEASHLKVCIEHLSKGENRLIVVCLDNIDQRPFEFQEQVFQIGHSLAETWPCNVFISLRPETFYHSRTKGALAAYQPRVFAVSPPRIDEVIVRRLQYAVNQLEQTGKVAGSPAWLSVNSASLLKYLRVLLESFEKSHELMESIDNMSGGNVREALRFVIAFVGSGHVNAEKIIERHEAEKDQVRTIKSDAHRGGTAIKRSGYVIPVHEFLRAVIYGDYAQFDPVSSPVCNVFDISSGDAREHFLLANMLAFVERSGGAAEGFVSARSIFDFAQQLGFQANQIHFALDRAADKKLLERSAKYAGQSEISDFRMTTVGAYTISRLLKFFVYLDAVVVDTPIVEDETRLAILNVEQIDQRIERGRSFCAYLDRQAMKLTGEAIAFDWGSARQDLLKNIEVAERAVQNAMAKGKMARSFRRW